jgi:hypothetical protein
LHERKVGKKIEVNVNQIVIYYGQIDEAKKNLLSVIDQKFTNPLKILKVGLMDKIVPKNG